MMRLGPTTYAVPPPKRERTSSQERALDADARPLKRLNNEPDDTPEEGELEDDGQSKPPTLPPIYMTPSPDKSRAIDVSRESRGGSSLRRQSSSMILGGSDSSLSTDGFSSRSLAAPMAAPSTKKVAFPFKMKEKPQAPHPKVELDIPEAFREKKETPLPQPVHSLPPKPPSLPPVPTFTVAAPKDEDRRGRKEHSPVKREQREPRRSPPREREVPPPRRDRSRERRDEFGRETRLDRGRDFDERHHRPPPPRAYDTWVPPDDRSYPDDWRPRRDDGPYDTRRDWDRRGRDSYYHDDRERDRDRDWGSRPYRPLSPPRHRDERFHHSDSPSLSPSASPRHRSARPTRSRSSRSRSRSRSRSSSRSRSNTRSSHTPSKTHNHHPSRLPQRAARPPSPPPLPRSLGREDVQLNDDHDFPPEPPKRSFQPFNMPGKAESHRQPQVAAPSSNVPLRPPAPHPPHEPTSLPTETIEAAGTSSVRPPPIGKPAAFDDEDEGEVKEDTPPGIKTPILPTPSVSVSKPAAEEKPESKNDDEIERKIREMEALDGKAPVVPKPPIPRPGERKPPVRRTNEQEKMLYGRSFTGVSRLNMYRREEKLGEGTFGEVFKATHVQTRAVVALKRILMHNEFQGMPITAVREIKLLKVLKHPNVVELVDIVMEPPSDKDDKGSIYMVFPYMDHDLAGLLENPTVSLQPSQIKLYMKQLLEGTAYLHRNHILHRDIKAANLLISNDGTLRIADFGLARPISKEWADKRGYTNCVVTRWYRPPELLMGAKVYDGAVDMWGCGCILAEMFERHPVLMGESDMGQLDLIFNLCGGPNDQDWPEWSKLQGCEGYEVKPNYTRTIGQRFRLLTNDTCDLIIAMLALNPAKRITADEALDHLYFWTDPLPADPTNMPKWSASKEYDRRKKMEMIQQQQQQQQQRLPPPVHYQPQQGNFNPNFSGRGHNHHNQNINRNNNFPGGPPPPPRMRDGLPPAVFPPNGGRQHHRQHQPPPPPQPAPLPVLRFGSGPPSLPPAPGPADTGLPPPAFGGPSGYNGPLVRGGKYPERPFHAGPDNRGRGSGGPGGRGPRGGGPGGLPYD